ncbi:potassium channel subfamily K member 4 isoform X2 [Monodelphis domestica]|uniref:potassium channel subfamily K member 4 isoform X2 n=1 Tax=Monodelphis domestica TaxID=13616 RepID=UPI0024E1DFF5|nr:potassium channel subfamily K member 4 isoform X2 [Monodelphis domestica]
MKKSILLELWLAVLTYVVIGAAIFRFLELPKEKEMQAIMKETREKFLRLHPCVSRSSFRVLVQNVVTSVTVGMDPGAYFTNKTRSTWTTEGAIFFAGSLVTTVGYGNVILLSDEGRIFCVFFIVLGIPLYGMLLTSTGEHVGTNLQARISTMENFLTKRQLLGTVMVRFLASIFFIGIGFLFFVALPVVIFITLENWSEVESFFYVIVTLTTVGFGDFVPGTNPVNTFWGYQYLVLLWIVLSLFYFASIITMIGNWIRQEMNNLEEQGQPESTTTGLKSTIRASDSVDPRDKCLELKEELSDTESEPGCVVLRLRPKGVKSPIKLAFARKRKRLSIKMLTRRA